MSDDAGEACFMKVLYARKRLFNHHVTVAIIAEVLYARKRRDMIRKIFK